MIVLSCNSKSCQHPNTSRYHEQKEIAHITDQCPIINQSTGSVFTAMCPFFQSLKKEKNARNQIEYHHTKKYGLPSSHTPQKRKKTHTRNQTRKTRNESEAASTPAAACERLPIRASYTNANPGRHKSPREAIIGEADLNEATGNLKGNLLIDVPGIINLRRGTQQKIKE